jgi:dienelactone hydrolase
MRYLAASLLAATVLFAAACGGGDGGDAAPTAPPLTGITIRYETLDRAQIAGEFFLPVGVDTPPVLILFHQFGGSRDQWRPVIDDFMKAGYAVVAPDLRSFGESTRCFLEIDFGPCELNDLDDLIKDAAAAIEWVQSKPDLDHTRIAVIGASVGGNLAYVSSGLFDQVKTAVAMSPNANPPSGALLGAGEENFNPRSVLFLTDEAEATDAMALAQNVTDPVEVKVYEGVSAHGVALFDADAEVLADILDWLRLHL